MAETTGDTYFDGEVASPASVACLERTAKDNDDLRFDFSVLEVVICRRTNEHGSAPMPKVGGIEFVDRLHFVTLLCYVLQTIYNINILSYFIYNVNSRPCTNRVAGHYFR